MESKAVNSLDARRLLCPMPVIRVQDRIAALNSGDLLKVYCTDPGALYDIPAWCRVHGHEIIETRQGTDELVILIKVAHPQEAVCQHTHPARM